MSNKKNTDLDIYLNKVLQFPTVKLVSHLFVYDYSGNSPRANLYLSFYIDQLTLLSREDILNKIEENIQQMCMYADGEFIERKLDPFKSNKIISAKYTLGISNYEDFKIKLEKYHYSLVEKEFMEALEDKLSE